MAGRSQPEADRTGGRAGTALVALLLLMLLAGCGGDDTGAGSDGGEGATTPSATDPSDPTPPPTEPSDPTPPPTAAPGNGSAAGSPSADCVEGWVTPERGTELRTEPLDALRARYGLTGLFVIDDMRYFEGPQDPSIIAPRYDHLRFWYVKASRQDDPSFRARWLLVAPPDGPPAVAATAPWDSAGFGPGDWVGFFGESDAPFPYPGLPGEYFGIAYDAVTGIVFDSGEPEGGPPAVPAEATGCLRGT